MTRRFAPTKPFTVLVANPATGRHGFRNQLILDSTGNARVGLMQGDPASATGTITISDAGFTVSEVAAKGGFTLIPPLSVGTTITINGNVLTGISGARTPGSDDFNVDAVDVATEIEEAINDVANSFSGDVLACAIGEFVGLTAVTSGTAGNSITLATNAPTEVSLSGATLVGGGQTEGQSKLLLGVYTLTTGVNWYPTVGDATASATALAAAISNLPGYSASAAITQATGSVTVAGVSLAGETITIDGVPLTAVAGARTPGSDDFSLSSGTVAGIAADIVAAINDGANSFTGIVTAADGGGGLVNLTAVPTGSAGNVSLATSDAVNYVLSGSTLTGGADAVSIVGPNGPEGREDLRFEAVYDGVVVNFILDPATGFLGGGLPTIGPPALL